MVATLPRNEHDAHVELCWRICRYGVAAVGRDPAAAGKVLAWIDRMRPRFPGSPWLAAWDEIVRGAAREPAAELRSVERFAHLTPERKSLWRPIIQSQPFGCIVPGRTTRERRAFFLDHPENEHPSTTAPQSQAG